MYVEDCDRLAAPFSFGLTMWSGHVLSGWRCRLNLSIFLLTISVGRFWSVHSVLEFNAIKKNLRIMSDIEKVFWTVLFSMASRVFLFFTLSDSSLVRKWYVCREPRTPVVKLVWQAFQPLFSRLLRWFMKTRWEQHLSFLSCSFFSAQSSFVSIVLVYSKNTHNFFPCQRLGHPASGLWRCLCLYRRSRWRRRCGILQCPYVVWPYSGQLLMRGSHAAPCIPRSCINPIPHEHLGLGLRENAIGVPKHCLVH